MPRPISDGVEVTALVALRFQTMFLTQAAMPVLHRSLPNHRRPNRGPVPAFPHLPEYWREAQSPETDSARRWSFPPLSATDPVRSSRPRRKVARLLIMPVH